jgi:hypothetical protein
MIRSRAFDYWLGTYVATLFVGAVITVGIKTAGWPTSWMIPVLIVAAGLVGYLALFGKHKGYV